MQSLQRGIIRVFLSGALVAGGWNILSPDLAMAGWNSGLPACSSGKVASRIVQRFNRADDTQWYNGVHISHISHAYERAYNIYPDSLINRRYCRGKALMSNGRYRRVHFVIEQGMGLAGYGWGVEYCLSGSDRWHAYGGWCRVLAK